MAEDLQTQVVALAYNGIIDTLKLLVEIIKYALKERNNHIQNISGKQPLKTLNLQGKQLESVDISNEDMKNFKKMLNQYSVDFSIVKDNYNKGQNIIFFKGQDVDRVYRGLENCIKNLDLNPDKITSKSIKEIMNNAVNKSKNLTRHNVNKKIKLEADI